MLQPPVPGLRTVNLLMLLPPLPGLCTVNFLSYCFRYLVYVNLHNLPPPLPEPTSSDDLITKHYISLNIFLKFFCVLGCVLDKILIFF